jgi:hypothetical protein
MWIGIAIISGLASLGGYALFQDSSPVVASVLATTIGFAVAFTIHVLD